MGLSKTQYEEAKKLTLEQAKAATCKMCAGIGTIYAIDYKSSCKCLVCQGEGVVDRSNDEVVLTYYAYMTLMHNWPRAFSDVAIMYDEAVEIANKILGENNK
jgi:hypothetical protein